MVEVALTQTTPSPQAFDDVWDSLPTSHATIRRNATLAAISKVAPRVEWSRFLHEHFRWVHGEHISLIGPTGQGKTTMLENLLPLHPYRVVFATKPRDKTMEALIQGGYLRMDRWYSLDPKQHPHRVVWPDASSLSAHDRQAAVFHHAFNSIYREGGWTVALDELWYINNILKLSMDVKTYLLQGRALGLSLLVATQRPAAVPVEIYDQSTHLMFWRDNDEANLKRLSGISWRSSNVIRHIIANLERFQVLYINTRTGEMFRTRCPKTELYVGREKAWLPHRR